MKILLLFPIQDKQTGSAIQYAFNKLGHQVKTVDAKLNWMESYRVALEFKPDLVFCSRTYQLTEEVKKIKDRFKDAKIAMWNVDVRENIEAWSHLYPLIRLCDYHFVPDSEHITKWRKLNRNTFWLPQGLQDEVYDKPKEITRGDKKKYSCDVSFAGTRGGFHKRTRPPFLDAVATLGVNFKQWGCNNMPRIYNEEHNKMVSLSKINIALSGWPNNKKYTSVRNYKILGAGGFMLEFYREGVHEIFPENVIRCYTSPGDLAEKVRYWLDHDQERQMMADAGYEWVHANATYTHRIKMALNYMEIK